MFSIRLSVMVGGFLGLLFIVVPPAPMANQVELKPVVFDVTVTERNSQSVRNLTKEEFSIQEDGINQKIESFSSQNAAFSLGLVIDSSGSIRPRLPSVQNAALQALTHLNKEDEACLIQFNTQPELLQTFTNDYQKLSQIVKLLQPTGGTSLLDAVYAAARYTGEHGKHRRKALLIITDGMEKNSISKEAQIAMLLKETRVQAYIIHLPPSIDKEVLSFVNLTPIQTTKAVVRLAEISGGQAFLPKRPDEASEIAGQIIEILRHQYQISYLSTNQKQDGGWRKFKVRVTPKTNLNLAVTTQPGYFAAGHITEKEKARQKEAEKTQKKKP